MPDTSSTFDPATGARLTGTGTTYFDPRSDPNKLLADIQTAGQDRNGGGNSLVNWADVTDPNGLTLVYKTNSAYDFAAITPAVTLTAATPVTLTLSPFPTGITASSPTIHKLRIVDAVGGDEVVTVTAVNVGTSVTFTPALNHASGDWTIQSASDGIQEGILALGTGGYLPLASGTLNVYGTVTIPFPFTIQGRNTTIAVYAGAGESVNAFDARGTIGSAINVTVTINEDRDASESSTITIAEADAAGLAAGDLLLATDEFVSTYYGGPFTYLWCQTARIRSKAGGVLTMQDLVYIPLVTTHGTHTIQKLTPASGIVIRDITFDGTNAAAATAARGIYLEYAADCKLEGLHFQNFTTAAGLNIFGGHNIRTDVTAKNCGSVGESDLHFSRVSWSRMDVHSRDAATFGPQWQYGVGLTLTCDSVGAQAGRASKLMAIGRSQANRWIGSYSTGTGLHITDGCWSLELVNVQTDHNTTSEGTVIAGYDDCSILIVNLSAKGNNAGGTGPGIAIYGSTAHDNVVLNYMGPDSAYDSGTRNFIGHAAAAGTWTAVSFLNSWTDYGGSYQTAAYLRDPAGTVHLRGSIKSGVSGQAAFQLPAGYYDAAGIRRFLGSGATYIEIDGSGNVKPTTGDNSYVSLDGISFRP